MARKRPIQKPIATPPPSVQDYKSHKSWWQEKNILLDWRFNLIILVVMELIIIFFFLPREIEAYHSRAGRNAMLKKDFPTAQEHYRWLATNEDEPAYLQAYGNVLIEMKQYQSAIRQFQEASGGRFDLPGMKIQTARAIYGMLPSIQDKKKQEELWNQFQEMIQNARREDPNGLAVNFYLARFFEERGDLSEAAEYYAKVRANAIPIHVTPTAEHNQLIREAQERLKAIRERVFEGRDYSLEASTVKIPDRIADIPTTRPVQNERLVDIIKQEIPTTSTAATTPTQAPAAVTTQTKAPTPAIPAPDTTSAPVAPAPAPTSPTTPAAADAPTTP